MPKVSVIVPVYCVERYIARCARSLFEQTLADIEYIFIDDASPDNSIEIIQKILEQYDYRKSQVHFYRMDHNSGLASVRKFGILHASGDYVYCCDSDDWVVSTACEKMYNTAIEQCSEAVLCDYFLTDGNNNRYELSGYVPDKDKCIRRLMLGKGVLTHWNKLFKRELYEDIYFPTDSMGEDYCMIIQLLLSCSKISYVNEALYNYYRNPESITSTKLIDRHKILNNFHQSFHNMEILSLFLEEHGFLSEYESEVNAMKLYQKNLLFKIINQKGMFALWKNAFPELGFSILFDRNVLLKERVKYFIITTRLYPLISWIFI